MGAALMGALWYAREPVNGRRGALDSQRDPESMNWWKQFKPKVCSVGIKSLDKQTVLSELVENLVKGSLLPKELADKAAKAFVDREQLASTGVGMNVAIPHVKLAGIDQVICSLSVHPVGVEWAAVDGEAVRVFFTVLRPDGPSEQHDPEQHLEMMRWIAKLSRDGDFRRFAIAAKTKTELVDLLKEMSAV